MNLIRRTVTALICLQLSLNVLPGLAHEAAEVATDSWWYNFPSSPLKFKPSNPDASYMDLENLSEGNIVRYGLGCVAVVDGHVQVKQRLALQGLKLTSGSTFFQSAREYRIRMEACNMDRPALAVVEVHFADGGLWTAGRELSVVGP